MPATPKHHRDMGCDYLFKYIDNTEFQILTMNFNLTFNKIHVYIYD